MTPKERQKWSEIRKNGKTRYITTRGVLGFGVPFLIAVIIYRIFFDNVLQRLHGGYQLFGQLVVCVPGSIFFGYYMGRKWWNTSEQEFKTQEPDAPRRDQQV